MKRGGRKKKSTRLKAIGDYGVTNAEVGPDTYLVENVSLGDGELYRKSIVMGENTGQSSRTRERWYTRNDSSCSDEAKTAVHEETKEKDGSDIAHSGGEPHPDHDRSEARCHQTTTFTASQLLEEFYGHGLLHTSSVLSCAKKKLMVYISSSCTDTKSERNLLFEKILPSLQHSFMSAGLEIVFIDFKYTLRDDSRLEQEFWSISERELQRCYRRPAAPPSRRL